MDDTERNNPGAPAAKKNERRSTSWTVIAVLAFLALAAFLLWWSAASAPPGSEAPKLSAPASTSPTTTAGASSLSPAPGARVLENSQYVVYAYFTGDAFVPETLVVNAGDKVRFVDASNLTMRVGSRPENLSSTAYASIVEAKAAGRGSTFDIVLSQPGIWAYENLSSVDPRIMGVVYVR